MHALFFQHGRDCDKTAETQDPLEHRAAPGGAENRAVPVAVRLRAARLLAERLGAENIRAQLLHSTGCRVRHLVGVEMQWTDTCHDPHLKSQTCPVDFSVMMSIHF